METERGTWMNHFIPLSIPNFEGNESKYVNDAVSQGWVSTGGAYIEKLEKELAGFLHVEKVVACQSGTSGLHLALIEAGVNPEDIVVVPSLTFIATVNPVKYQFAEPLFMDCDDSLCIDVDKLRKFCEEECEFQNGKLFYKVTKKHIKAVIVVHVFGNFADMESIMDIAQKYNLKIIEDATEALGSKYIEGKYDGQYAGTIGDFGVYSFNGNKIITTGGGGAVTAKNVESIDHIKYLSTQAKDDIHYYVHNEIGYNYRMTNIQAAIGVAQLEKLPEFIRRKQKNYELYKKLFKGFELGKILEFRYGTSSNKWFYSLEIDKSKVKAGIREIIMALEKRGIQTRTVWGLVHKQKPYMGALSYKIEKAEYYSSCILNFPCSTQIMEEEIIYAAEQIKQVLGEYVYDRYF